MKALLSIHDVMPDNRQTLTELLALLYEKVSHLEPKDITLLVVPGRKWRDDDVRWLKQLETDGHPFAAHGWIHAASDSRDCYHKIHSALLSRNAAEHLSKSKEELYLLLNSSVKWFIENEFNMPELYVPPAWAVGKLKIGDLRAFPYKQLETLGEVVNTKNGERISIPLCGYEADTKFRAYFLKQFNAYSKRRAIKNDDYIRIAIHPQDHNLLLAENMIEDLQEVDKFCSYKVLSR